MKIFSFFFKFDSWMTWLTRLNLHTYGTRVHAQAKESKKRLSSHNGIHSFRLLKRSTEHRNKQHKQQRRTRRKCCSRSYERTESGELFELAVARLRFARVRVGTNQSLLLQLLYSKVCKKECHRWKWTTLTMTNS